MYVRNQFMGITLLFCWIQILDFLAFHPLFGPWAIIIGECLLDVGKFVVVLALFVFGYAMLGSSMNQPFGLPSEYINDPELNPDQLSQDKLFSVMAAEEANNPLFMFEVKGVRKKNLVILEFDIVIWRLMSFFQTPVYLRFISLLCLELPVMRMLWRQTTFKVFFHT